MDSVTVRRKRSKLRPSESSQPTGDVQSLFAPDEFYDFQEGHYDGVIHHYREMHLTSWPLDEFSGLANLLERLHSLCPTPKIQTHLLHLASYGEILPHVDNIGASGAWILGVSLGNERVLRLESNESQKEYFDLALPSGSVYLQRDHIRYTYKHSIRNADGENPNLGVGQRLSVIFRDLPLPVSPSDDSSTAMTPISMRV